MKNDTTKAIEAMEATRGIHASRGPLFARYVADCDRMLARLRAGLPLTRHDRGLPSETEIGGVS